MTAVNFVYVDLEGNETEVSASVDQTLMEVATENGVVGIDGDCGGSCACGTCRIRLPAELHSKQVAMQEDERDVLAFSEADNADTRLGCQIKVTEAFAGARVVVATEC